MKVATGSGKFVVCFKTQLLLCVYCKHTPSGRKDDVCFVAAAVRSNFRFIGSRSAYVCTDVFRGVFYDFTSQIENLSSILNDKTLVRTELKMTEC